MSTVIPAAGAVPPDATAPDGAPDVVATLRFDPDGGLAELPETLAAMAATAAGTGFGIDRHAIANDLQAATFRRIVPSLVRLRASRGGAIAIEVRDA